MPTERSLISTVQSLDANAQQISNIWRQKQAAATHAGIDKQLECILSVEAVSVFKPHPKVYQHAVDSLSTPAEHIHFFSSNGWDVAGAATFGFTVTWVNRPHKEQEHLPNGPHYIVQNLQEALEHLPMLG